MPYTVDEFVTIKDGIITGYLCGNIEADLSDTPYDGHERAKVPDGSVINIGEPVEFYYDYWVRKTDIVLIEEGLMQVPQGFVVDNFRLREMTEIERMKSGMDEIPEGFKIDDNDALVEMTLTEKVDAGIEQIPIGQKLINDQFILMTQEEKLFAGLITQEEINAEIKAKNEMELESRLAELQTSKAVSRAEVDDDYAAERKLKMKALLAVEQQEGWPLEVVWPEEGAGG